MARISVIVCVAALSLGACSKDKADTAAEPDKPGTEAEPDQPDKTADAAKTQEPAATATDAAAAADKPDPSGATFSIEGCDVACKQAIKCGFIKADKEKMCDESCQAAEDAELAMKARDCVFDATTCDKIKACDGYEVVLFAD